MELYGLKRKNLFWIAFSIVAFFIIATISSTTVEAQKTEVRYLSFIDPSKPDPRSKAYQEIINNFEKKYPQYKVVVDVVPWQEIDKTLISAVASGKGPDVARISSLVLGQHIPAKTITPLDRFISGWTLKQKEDFIAPWDMTVFDGRKMAFFLENRTAVLYYREDYLKKAGFDGRPPATLEDLTKQAAGVQKAVPNAAGMAIGLSSKKRASTLQEIIPPFIWSAGGEVIDGKERAIYNNPGGVKAFGFMKDLVRKHEVMPRSVVAYTYDEIHSSLQAGTIAMATLGTHRYITIRSGMKPEVQKFFKTAPVPGFGKTAPCLIFGWVLTITSVSKNPEGAWKFIEHMTSPESQFINAKLAGELPARKATYQNPWFNSEEASYMAIWKDYINSHGKVFKYPEKYTEMAEGWGEALQKIILQDADTKQTLDEAAQKYNSLLK